MRTRSRRLLIAACVVIGVVVILSVAVRLVLTRDVLIELVVPRLETAIGAEIQIGDIGIRFPFGFGVDIKDLSFERSMPQGEVLNVGMERLVAKASLLSLIKKKPVIKSVDISGGSLKISGGRMPDEASVGGINAGLSMRPEMEGFLVRADLEASVVSIPTEEKGSLVLNDLGFEGDMALDAAYESLHIERASAVWGDLMSLALSGDISDLKTAQNVELRIVGKSIELAPLMERIMMLGLMPDEPGGGRELALKTLSGSIGIESDIEGSMKTPSSMVVSGRIHLQQVAAGTLLLQEPVTAIGDIDFDMQGARSDKVSVRFGSSSADISFSVTLGEGRKIDLLRVGCKTDLELKDLVPAARREALGMDGGAVTADIEFEGLPADLEALFPTGEGGVSAPDVGRAWERARLALAVDFDGIDLESPGSPLTLSGLKGKAKIEKGSLKQLEATFHLNGSPYSCSASIDKLMPALVEMAAVLKKTPPASLTSLDPIFRSFETKTLVSARIDGRSFDAAPFEKKGDEPGRAQREGSQGAVKEKADPLVANPLTLLALKGSAFRVSLDTIRTAKAVFTGVDAQGTIINGRLRADPVTLDYAGGSGKAVIESDLSTPGRIKSDIDLSLDKVQAAVALGALHPLGGLLDGSFSFQAEAAFESGQAINPLMTINGKGSALSTAGSVDLSRFLSPITGSGLIDLSHLEQVDFKDWRGNFIMRNGRFVTDNWSIKSNRGDWSIKGSFGIDGTLDYDVHLIVPPGVQRDMKDLSKYRDLVNLFRDQSGNLVLDLQIGGTSESPKVSLDMTAAKSKAADNLIDKAKDWLKKQ